MRQFYHAGRQRSAVGNGGDTGATETNRLYINNGAGVYSSDRTLGVDLATSSVELGDVDGDNDLDAVFSNTEGGGRVFANGNEPLPDPAPNDVWFNEDCGMGLDLAVTKTIFPTNLAAGQSAVYTVSVTNLGAVAASGVVVTDSLPAEVTFTSVSATNCVLSNGQVVCNFGALAPSLGTSFTINVSVNCITLTPITNSVTVSADIIDVNPANNTAVDVADIAPLIVTFVTNSVWWTARNVRDNTAAPVDYGLVLQGQVKQMVVEAFNEIEAVVPCGAGTNIADLINGFSLNKGNYMIATAGQLKNVAVLFYHQ